MYVEWDERFGPVYRFRQAEYTHRLHIEEDTPYVEASTVAKIREALEAGYAVYGEGCDGRVFVWPTQTGYAADRFFLGPPRFHRFETAAAAADFAAELCE
jgi:hypothetical protein